jgi:DNA repair exonuclease SbcCD ATPase subunit
MASLEKVIKEKQDEIDNLNKKLQEASKNLDDKIKEKEKEIEELKGRLNLSSSDWEKKLDEKEKEIQNLKDTMKKSKENLEKIVTEKMEEIKANKAKLDESLKKIQDMITEKDKQLKDANKELGKQSQGFEKDIGSKDNEIAKLTEKIDKITKDYDDKVASKEDQITKLQKKMDDKVEELQKTIQTKEKELDEIKKSSGLSTDEKLVSKENEIKRLNEELKKLTTDLQNKIDEKEKEIAKLNDKLNQKTGELEKDLTQKEKEKQELDKKLALSTDDLQKIVDQKTKEIAELNKKYDELESMSNKKIKELEIKLEEETKKYENINNQLKKTIEEKDAEIDRLKKNAGNAVELSKQLDAKQNELNALNLKMKNSTQELKTEISNREKEISELKKKISSVDKNVDQKQVEIDRLNALIKTTNVKKDEEINKLKKNMTEIQTELDKFKSELSKVKLQNTLLEGYKKRCKEKFLKDKEQIIEAIKDYKAKWIAWSKTVSVDSDVEKSKLFSELTQIKENLKSVMRDKDLLSDDYNQFKTSANEIKTQLEKTISDQIVELNKRDEQIKEMSQKEDSAVLDEKNRTIEKLQNELAEVRKLLAQNDGTKIQVNIDCDNALKNFCSLNNIFFRKMEIIKKLDEIIQNKMGVFPNLDDTIKQDITTRFETVKTTIMKHINFLNLKKYINDQVCRQYLEYLKSDATRNKVPADFCNEMINLLDYWNVNKLEYREQDRQLTNIYEDLSGAIRVYIRIKPLVGERSNVISVKTFGGKKSKSVTVNCKGQSSDFGDFYGVFEDSYKNIDVYTGVPNTVPENKYNVNIDAIVENTESISPGLYSVFKQAEDGYSIVVFGYGLSGSGKTISLIGNETMPGLMHYGFANLQGVKNIKLKYLFEQYYGNININFNKITGRIHNLVREVPQLNVTGISRNENEQFKEKLSASNVNIDDLSVDQFTKLTNLITEYRKDKGRIKKTPNNDESSRSHLYLVFEVSFASGKKGYITIIDMAGRESPMDIFNTFIDTSKTKLASVMAPAGGVELIKKTLKPGLNYAPENVLDILKEGFYINEAINHLVYYFNKKNFRNIKVIKQAQNPDQYDVSKYYVKPQDEENTVKMDVGNNCLTIPILKFLEGLSSKGSSSWLPTKFVTIVAVRQEERYCTQTLETLNFAQSIKSS